MIMNGAGIIIRSLERHGIDTVAGIPGGSNLPLYDALYRSPIRHILARHEQGAGFIAHGMARSTGRTAVCLATSGPGVTNLLTAIADAKLDSVPIIAITGQVPTALLGTDAFQEVDTYGMTVNITKHNYLVQRTDDLPAIMDQAFAIAASGRPGPVLVDVPKDVQMHAIDVPDSAFEPPCAPAPPPPGNEATLRRIAAMIEGAHRPLIYAGGGIIQAGAAELLRALARKNSIPVALTLMGLGAFPPDDPLSLGMLGMHGATVTNYSLDETDLLLAFGVRFDDRAIGKAREFCPHARIIHIDIDNAEIDKIKKSHCSLSADIALALAWLYDHVSENERPEWRDRIAAMKTAHPVLSHNDGNPLQPLALIRSVGRLADPRAIITTDVGQHQMWVAQAYPFRHPRTLLTSGGLGTMGFGLPAAIGAALAHPGGQVICFSGDGSIQMNIQELATLAELDLNVKIFIMNNQHLGLVRQQQELFYERHYIASHFPRRMNFAGIAREYGIDGYALTEGLDPERELMRILSASGPAVIDVPIHHAAKVFPMVPPGAANREMIDHQQNHPAAAMG